MHLPVKSRGLGVGPDRPFALGAMIAGTILAAAGRGPTLRRASRVRAIWPTSE